MVIAGVVAVVVVVAGVVAVVVVVVAAVVPVVVAAGVEPVDADVSPSPVAEIGVLLTFTIVP